MSRAGRELRFSVIVPVHDEARGLAGRARRLLEGLPPGCEVVFVCNGCTDGSEAILRRAIGRRALVLACPRGKARAIRLGEARTALLPRFYVDSDVEISGADLARLARALTGGTHLVSPRIAFDLAGASWAARELSRFWLALPHGAHGAFHHVLGVSAAGRARWGAFPELVADDAFIEAHFAPDEKRILPEVTVRTRPPRRLRQWIGVRARWQRGLDELRALGIRPARSPRQFAEVARAALSPGRFASAQLYIAAVLLARLSARLRPAGGEWFRDDSSR